jgi:hypothetical protein
MILLHYLTGIQSCVFSAYLLGNFCGPAAAEKQENIKDCADFIAIVVLSISLNKAMFAKNAVPCLQVNKNLRNLRNL